MIDGLPESERLLVLELAFRLSCAFTACDRPTQRHLIELMRAINNCPRRDLVGLSLDLADQHLEDHERLGGLP